ncbi:MAG: DUF6273 domain-containing protein [Anaerobutyricum soehngenii]
MKGKDATYSTSSSSPYYNWNNDYNTYHYFKYEPIKWRVLSVDGTDALLLADVALDDQRYNLNYKSVTWATSSIRSWLNGYGVSANEPQKDYSHKNFLNAAFSSEEKNAIKITNVINDNNILWHCWSGILSMPTLSTTAYGSGTATAWRWRE